MKPLLCLLLFAQSSAGLVHGRVLDSRTGEGLARVIVSIQLKIETTTDDSGAFRIPAVPAGDVELYISTVGYGLIRKRIQIAAGTETDVEVRMGQVALRRTDEVTVTADVYEERETAAISQHTLDNSEIKNLAGVLVDDPLRSVQTLPGVATGDDFNAQFAVRGAGFRKVGFYIASNLGGDAHPHRGLQPAGGQPDLRRTNRKAFHRK